MEKSQGSRTLSSLLFCLISCGSGDRKRYCWCKTNEGETSGKKGKVVTV
jgi:hypothetical protein